MRAGVEELTAEELAWGEDRHFHSVTFFYAVMPDPSSSVRCGRHAGLDPASRMGVAERIRFEQFDYAVKWHSTAVKPAVTNNRALTLKRTFVYAVMPDLIRHPETIRHQIAPREVLKQAFHYTLLENGEAWLQMPGKRNLLAHTYCEKVAREANRQHRQRIKSAVTKG